MSNQAQKILQNRLSTLRERHGLTQIELGRKLYSEDTNRVKRKETGKSKFTVHDLYLYANFFCVPMHSLFVHIEKDLDYSGVRYDG
jgi:transcriptional regulator with XRE-family HTH domain